MLLTCHNHLFDILPGSNTKQTIAVTEEVHSEMERDGLEVVLVLKDCF
jgi:hypothetical protein